MSKFDVVFIGAGPVGLYTAIQTKLYNPELKIVMKERHREYIRHHILDIDKNSYQGSHPDPEFQQLLKSLSGKVPTSTIESKLLAFAKKLGIEIEYSKVDDVNALAKQFPQASIIGSDGARSLVRKQIFDDEKTVDENLQYIIELKYHCKGQTKPLRFERYPFALSQTEHFVSEHVGKQQDGKTPVSLFFFVDKQTYEDVRKLGGNAAKGLTLDNIDPQASANIYRLANSIRPWLAARREANKEQFILGSEKIAGVALPIYHSTRFVSIQKGQSFALVGDAAMGVPYFRALNAGIIGANHVAKYLSKNKDLPTLSAEESQEQALNRLMQELAEKEIHQAKRTNFGVKAGITYAGIKRMGGSFFGASLHPDILDAMQNARIERPGFIQRHPRLAMAFGYFAVLSLILSLTLISTGALPVAGTFSTGAFGAIALGVLGSGIIVGSLSLIVMGLQQLSNYFNRKRDNPELETIQFPWEHDAIQMDSSVRMTSKLGIGECNKSQPESFSESNAHPPVSERAAKISGEVLPENSSPSL